MPDCPACQTPLRTIRQREGIYYLCDQCGGRAVTFPQIRRVAGDRFTTQLLRQINATTGVQLRKCPFCDRPMKQFLVETPPLTLDACKPCGAVWFDPVEFETVPEKAVESVVSVRPTGAEALALYKLEKRSRASRIGRLSDDPPDESWKWLPALFGFPVEMECATFKCRPWVTWSLAAAITAVSIAAFFDLRHIVEQFGMIPAQIERYGGATLLTSFFLHGGIWHLISNLYFLVLFGDNVEDSLGRRRYVLLILAAALTGDLVHWLMFPNSTIPCVGASGGISGIIVYYALKFPRVRLGFLVRFIWWVQIPAWGALALWTLLQCLGVFQQLYGFGGVAATAHLGGAAAGLAFWWYSRKNETQTA